MRARWAFSAAILATSIAVQFDVEHAFGLDASFSPRCALSAEVDGAGKVTLSTHSDVGAGKLSPADISQLAAALEADELYVVKVRAGGGSPTITSTKACALVSSGLVHNVRLSVDSTGLVRGVDLVVPPPRGAPYSGCKGRQGVPPTALAAFDALVAKGADGAAQLTSKFLVVGVEDAAPVPTLPGGKGSAYPGQKEFTDADVASVMGGGGLGGGKAAPADAEAALAAKKVEDPKSFLERNWHILAIGAVWIVMRMAGGGEEAAPARPGGTGAGATVKRQAARA